MQMTRVDDDHSTGSCDRCGQVLERWRGESDIECDRCGAIYNASGQRLRDDLYSRPNPSSWDDSIDDLTGYELAMGFDE